MAMATPKGQTAARDDPFDTTPTSANRERARSLRHSQLDPSLSTSFTRGSPSQAKRALEAHLADTDRRIQDASKLGTTLLDQKKRLAERLKDLESQQGDEEIGADLKHKLDELEKEYNEVGRETARAFIPKSSRGSINFNAEAERTPLAEKGSSVNAEKKARPESVEVNGKTTTRRSRNQPQGSKADLEFATEISTSLLGQVRSLQNALMEKEDLVKKLQKDNSQLQSDAEVFSQRMRGLDDQEQKYKDENWTLETQVQDLTVQIKELAMREQKLQTSLNTANQQKSTSEREYEELRSQHGRLTEDHSTLRRKHDVHVADLKRDLNDGSSERDEMQKRIDELYSQNQNLAKAVAFRVKTEQGATTDDVEDDEVVESIEIETPETSPPTSPVKATPRHGGLESETLKSSLTHAHRMIQNLKNNMHREKTEKMELKRMLQDARDDLEQQRSGGAAGANAGRKRQPARGQDALKKPGQLGQLGSMRNISEWEDYEDSPSKHTQGGRDVDLTTDASDAFETADEKGAGTQTETETEAAFESAADTMAGSSNDDLTETEGEFKRSVSSVHSRDNRRNSLESTASDEGDAYDLTTPPRQPKYKLKLNRGGMRRSETPGMRDSPASFISNTSQTRSGLNLASELEGMDSSGSAATSRAATVDRSPEPYSLSARTPVTPKTPSLSRSDTTVRSSVPPPPPKPVYVDSATLTEAWEPEPRIVEKLVEIPSEPRIVEKVVHVPSEPKIVEKIVQVPAEPKIVERVVEKIVEVPIALPATRETATQMTPGKDQERDITSEAPSVAAQASMLREQDASPTPLQISGIQSQSVIPLHQKLVDDDTPTTPRAHIPAAPLLYQPKTPENGDAPESSTVPSVGNDNKLAPSTQQFLNDILAQARLKRAEHAPSRSSQTTTATSAASPEATSAERSAAQVEQPSSPAASIFLSGGPAREPSTPTRIDANGSPTRKQRSEKRFEENLSMPEANLPDSDGDEALSTYATPQALASGAPWMATQRPKPIMASSGTQTSMTAEQVESLVKENKRLAAHSSLTSSPLNTRSTPSGRASSIGSSSDPNIARSLKRPGSSAGTSTTRSRATDDSRDANVPPLPPGHRELIAQAKDRSSSLMNMPPPNLTPAVKGARDRSSSNFGTSPMHGTAMITGTSRSRAPSVAGTMVSRRSSVSSFASEIDERFYSEANRGAALDLPAGQGVIADPRMIQAITQTMIGEFLWKYTRKAGRGDSHSENRHRRFFWIHPYTRTLYWSNQDPSMQQRNELKAKSVAIEAVRVISDENPLPPGLCNKSIIIVTPGRSIKFTAPTSRRHEVWFNALSYLLLRSAPERDEDLAQNANIYSNVAPFSSSTLANDRSGAASSGITAEDLADFNAGPSSRTNSRMSHRSNASAATRRSTMRTSSPQGRTTPNSLAVRQSQAAAKRAAQPSPLTATPRAPDSEVSRRTNSHAATEAASKDTPASGDVDAEGFKKPAKPKRPASTTSKASGVPSNAGSDQQPKSKGGFAGLTNRISRASFASIGRGRKSQRAGVSSSHSNKTDADSTTGSIPADPASLAGDANASHEHVYKTQRREDGTLENVRACCNGKHDLASLRERSVSRTSMRSASQSQSQTGGRRRLSQRLSGLPGATT